MENMIPTQIRCACKSGAPLVPSKSLPGVFHTAVFSFLIERLSAAPIAFGYYINHFMETAVRRARWEADQI